MLIHVLSVRGQGIWVGMQSQAGMMEVAGLGCSGGQGWRWQRWQVWCAVAGRDGGGRGGRDGGDTDVAGMEASAPAPLQCRLSPLGGSRALPCNPDSLATGNGVRGDRGTGSNNGG